MKVRQTQLTDGERKFAGALFAAVLRCRPEFNDHDTGNCWEREIRDLAAHIGVVIPKDDQDELC